VEQLTFGEFVLALPSPCASYIVDVPGSGRQGVIDFGHEFAYYMVDRLLGGVGRHEVPARSLSELERMVVQIAAERVAGMLTDVWKDYVKLNLQVSGFESIPEMLRVANREDPVLVANLLVSARDMSSLLVLCLPFSTVEKFFTGTTARRPEEPQGSPDERRADRQRIETTVRDSQIAVSARLPSFTVPMHELATLQPGGLLHTGLEPDSELELYVVGQKRFRGAAGRVGRNLAVRVVDRVRPDPEFLIAAGRDTPPAV
jgi:flagellar motor switch protein FliM